MASKSSLIMIIGATNVWVDFRYYIKAFLCKYVWVCFTLFVTLKIYLKALQMLLTQLLLSGPFFSSSIQMIALLTKSDRKAGELLRRQQCFILLMKAILANGLKFFSIRSFWKQLLICIIICISINCWMLGVDICFC